MSAVVTISINIHYGKLYLVFHDIQHAIHTSYTVTHIEYHGLDKFNVRDVTKTSNRNINGTIHNMCKFHRKASFHQCTFVLPVSNITLILALLFIRNKVIMAC